MAAAAMAGGLLLPLQASAGDASKGALHILHPSTRETPLPGATAIGYLSIENDGKADDTLLGAESPDAASVEIHQMKMDGGLMRMRPLSGGVPIAAGAKVDLGPDSASGDHLMLIGVKRQLKAGEVLPVTLRFARAGTIATEFEVIAIDRE